MIGSSCVLILQDADGAVCTRGLGNAAMPHVLVNEGVSARSSMPVDQLQTGRLAPVKASACAQGYGGGSAVGGGQTGGDQFTSDEPSRKQQGQDAAYGGDQTNLDAGADTNFGVSAIQCYRLWTLYSIDLQCTVAGKLGTAAKCVLFREVV